MGISIQNESSARRPLRLFEAYGVELEYMIVARDTFDVMPVSDEALRAAAGTEGYVADAIAGDVTYSNELTLHVLELKTTRPAATLAGWPATFTEHVQRLNGLLAPLGARLMPAAMHPWMNPHAEMRLWPHDSAEIYAAFDRIFSCRGHGWANLQSAHLNLPFGDDEEFGRLHAAVRLALPILPALAASSPIMDGRVTGLRDTRLHVYQGNAARVPSVAGRVIPEPVFTRAEYERDILGRIYRDVAPHDTDGILQHEWLNARGAIARFDRNAIEIRVLDVQETPLADLAIHAAVVALVRALVEERWTSHEAQRGWPVEPLHEIFLATVRDAEAAVIGNLDYLAALGLSRPATPCTTRDLWRHLHEELVFPRAANIAAEFRDALRVIQERGTLATRLLAALGDQPSKERLREVYGRLCDGLASGTMFIPDRRGAE